MRIAYEGWPRGLGLTSTNFGQNNDYVYANKNLEKPLGPYEKLTKIVVLYNNFQRREVHTKHTAVMFVL